MSKFPSVRQQLDARASCLRLGNFRFQKLLRTSSLRPNGSVTSVTHVIQLSIATTA